MFRALTAFLVVCAGLACAQTATQSAPAPLAFEVADVQISKPGGKPNVDFLPGGKLVLQFLTMKELITAAWDLRDNYVFGGPAWLDSEHYDIVAKALITTPENDLRTMLQNLLKERFKLEAHLEKRPMPVFALLVGKATPKLKPSPAGEDKPACKVLTPAQRKDGLLLRTVSCTRVSMDDLASRLGNNIASAYIDRPVVNLTELRGFYDFTLEWTPMRNGRGPAVTAPGEASDPTGIDIFDALQSQVGLKLDARKLPMDVLVVDKVNRIPE